MTTILTLPMLFFLGENNSYKLLAILVLLLSSYVSKSVIDTSYDGNMYHLYGVDLICRGWNFLTHNTIPEIELSKVGYATVNYPKVAWTIGAYWEKIFGSVQAGKSFNISILFIGFLYLRHASRNIFRISRCNLTAALLVINPATFYQISSFCVDNSLYILILISSIASFVWLEKREKDQFSTGIILVSSLALLWGLKFTAPIYSTCIISLIVCWRFLLNFNLQKLKSLWLFVLGIVISLSINFNPYFTNQIHFGNPFYPAFGHPVLSTHIIESQITPEFLSQNYLKRIFSSYASRSDNFLQKGEPIQYKVPGLVYPSELKSFLGEGGRIAGFGPLFSLLLILGLGFILLRRTGSEFHLLLLLIASSGFANPHAWWARLSPQLYLFGLFSYFFLISYDNKLILKAVVCVLLLNIILVTGPQIVSYSYSVHKYNSYIRLIQENNKLITIDFSPFWYGQKTILEEKGIFLEEKATTDKDEVIICVPSNAKISINRLPKSIQAKFTQISSQSMGDFLKAYFKKPKFSLNQN